MTRIPQPTHNRMIHSSVAGHDARIPIRPSSPMKNSIRLAHASADKLPPRVDLDRTASLCGHLETMPSWLDCQARMPTLLTVTMISMDLLQFLIQTVPPLFQILQEGQPHDTFVQLCVRHQREGFSLMGLTGTFFFGSNLSFLPLPNTILLLF